MDVGPASLAAYAAALANARTVLWNGPIGVYELAPFAGGTLGLARLLADLPAQVVVAGGDAVAAAQASGRADAFAHLSTGGGATLELIEGRDLPGIAAPAGGLRRGAELPLGRSPGLRAAQATDGAIGLALPPCQFRPPPLSFRPPPLSFRPPL